jgi:predicted aspartyl protease
MAPRSQSFTATADARRRELVTPCKISAAFDPAGPKPHRELFDFTAIWDTGATNSVISPSVVTACGLKPIGMTEVHTANGTCKAEQYSVNIYLPNRVAFQSVRVTNQPLVGTPVLIGMDIIGMGDFAVTHMDGKTMFSYRWPSLERIDFVEQKQKPVVSASGPGRNSPCPCGSGRKYKRCCGKSGGL